MSKVEARKKIKNNLNNGKSINDTEAISGTLSLDKSKSSKSVARPRPKSAERANASMPNLKYKHGSDHSSLKDKKSIWNWKPLRALSHVRNRRFNCGFTLEVHTIEGLPSELNGLSISVHWKRRDEEVVTKPIKVVDGVAEFGEKLLHTCSVSGSRSGSHNSAKYEAKHFLLYVAIPENPNLDLGKHRIDLTRLLPLTLEELEGEKSSGSWTTSFKLLGNANGAVMNVSFGYVVLGDNVAPSNKNVLKLLGSNSTVRSNTKSNHDGEKGSIRRSESCPIDQRSSMTSRFVDDVKVLREVTPERISELSSSLNTLYENFDDEKSSSLVDDKSEIVTSADDFESLKSASCTPSELSRGNSVDENEHTEFSFIDKGIESMAEKLGLDQNSPKFVNQAVEESPDLIQGNVQEEPEFIRHEGVAHDFNSGQKEMSTKESLLEDLESVLNCVANLEKEVLDSPETNSESSDWGNEDEDKPNRMSQSNLDDILESDANLEEEELDTPEAESEESSDRENEVEDKPNGIIHSNLDDVVESGANLEKEELDPPEAESEASSDRENEVEEKPNEITHSNLDDVVDSVANLEKEELDTPEAESEESTDRENEVEDKSNGTTQSNLDNIVESVAEEFLSKLGIENSPMSFNSAEEEPESPRERLLREFEKEAEASGCPIFGFDIDDRDEEGVADYEEEDWVDCNYNAPTVSGWEEDFSEGSDISPIIEPESPQIIAKVRSEYPKIRAKVMEDLETEELFQDWGLDEKAFESSPPNSAGGCGSPIYLSPKEPPPLPPLGEGLGSFVRTKNGGFLRSMNPVLFSNAKSGGSLIMQVTSPVVVPADLGSEVKEILQTLASLGLEQLSMQANKLMPLEEISGKTIQQIAWEAAHEEASERHDLQPGGAHVTCTKKTRDNEDSTSRNSKKANSNYTAGEVDTEYVSLEDLAPLAMDKIEALSIKGLRIQCGMEDEEEAPSNISAKSIREFSALKGKRTTSNGTVGFDGAVGLQLLNLKDSETDEIDGLIGLSLTLDEWIKLDSGEIDEDGEMRERTSKVLAAHHANCPDLNIFERNKKGKASGRRSGLLGNNFTVALMVQLHDPFRNYEPVGTPMLGLIQAERVFLPPKPKIYSTIPKARDTYDDEDDELEFKEEEKTQEDELIPQFKIDDVHVAGLRNEPGKKNPWGSASQEQSGSRWLLANGMGESNKTPFMKSKVTPQPGDTLWSISSLFLGNGSKSKESCSGTVFTHIRNPNVILPNEIVKLR